jgi:hypothetical protein
MTPCLLTYFYHNLCGVDDAWRTAVIPGRMPLSGARVNYTDCGHGCNYERTFSHDCKDAWLLYLDADGSPLATQLVDNSGSAVLVENLTLGVGCSLMDNEQLLSLPTVSQPIMADHNVPPSGQGHSVASPQGWVPDHPVDAWQPSLSWDPSGIRLLLPAVEFHGVGSYLLGLLLILGISSANRFLAHVAQNVRAEAASHADDRRVVVLQVAEWGTIVLLVVLVRFLRICSTRVDRFSPLCLWPQVMSRNAVVLVVMLVALGGVEWHLIHHKRRAEVEAKRGSLLGPLRAPQSLLPMDAATGSELQS